ncbi:MAG TPA: hypothetical protein VFO10_19305 [Oligoflexus sp.]|uniref:hypothetical protein n=1 Tax=Oligoflexus sp. TaxID=1971216 RepID=UPI002D7FE227|nr:hypothetical protein [Oligoflexus sp.]HET9239418.1 hypothetical protein [Oligoflexus sp.]
MGLTHRFENPIFIDKITANIMYYPGIKLMDPSRVDVENDDPVLKRGNSLDFDEKHANLLIISPRASSCYFRETICFNLSPLSAPIFTANQQFKMYVAPFAGIQIQQRILGAQWFVAYDTNLFEDQSAWTLGASF